MMQKNKIPNVTLRDIAMELKDIFLHLFYAYFTHDPNTSASAQYDNTRGAWLTQEGCTITERKEGRINPEKY